jgi:transglutaminase-like putative cysteine protease
MMARIWRKLVSADALGLILVLIALQTLTYGVSSSLRGTDTASLFLVCIIAALVSLLLSTKKLNGIQASALIVALGVIGVWILGARLAHPLLDLLKSVDTLIPQIIPAIREQIAIDTAALTEAWAVILQASSTLTARWQTWLLGIDRNVTVNDGLIRNMIWTLLMWLIAAWAGWFAGRRNAILALLPSVVLLAVVISYSEYKVGTLWMMVFILLLLMGVWNYKNHTIQWERRRVDYSDSIRYDNTQAILFLAISLGIIAYLTPSFSWRQLRDYLRERNNSNEAAEILGIQEQAISRQNTFFQKPALPRDHLLTGGFAQSQKIVMTIRTGELAPIMNSSLTGDAPRYYWRSIIYDKYMGAGWVTSTAPLQSYEANTPLIPGLLDGYRPLHLDVQLEQPEGKLFWSGILYSADIPVRANWRSRPQSNLFADQTTLLQADMFAATTSAASYKADTFIPTVTIEELRSASTNYPEQIRDRYLALPQDLPQRVRELAAQIIEQKGNPYDQAKAIESYLRTNYPYDLDVPAPPEDQDVADYFLFDLKKGYCDYYATAMVVLARASGLPARFVSGYSPGSYDPAGAQYIVRELNAHSWAEVYFPEIGWIEFEPTASQPEIERLETESEIRTASEPGTPLSRFLFQLRSTGILYWLSPFIIALFVVIIYFSVIERLLFMSLTPLKAVEIVYREYYRWARPLAGEPTRAETAHEFTDKLTRKLEQIGTHSRRIRSSKRLQADAQHLTDIYHSSLFSKHAAQKSDARAAFNTWRQLRWQLIVARMMDFAFAHSVARNKTTG